MKWIKSEENLHKEGGDINEYKYVEKPDLLLEYFYRYMYPKEFSILINWSFLKSDKKNREEQLYNFSIDQNGDKKEEILLEIDKVISDSIDYIRNKHNIEINIKDYQEYINKFKNSVSFLK